MSEWECARSLYKASVRMRGRAGRGVLFCILVCAYNFNHARKKLTELYLPCEAVHSTHESTCVRN